MTLINPHNYPKEYQEFAQHTDDVLSFLEGNVEKLEGTASKVEQAKRFFTKQLPELRKISDRKTLDNIINDRESEDTAEFMEGLFTIIQDTMRVIGNDYQALAKTLVAKNINYGSSFDLVVDDYGLPGMLIRFADKANRLIELTQGNPDLVGEALEDTLLDIAGYATLSIIYITRKSQL